MRQNKTKKTGPTSEEVLKAFNSYKCPYHNDITIVDNKAYCNKCDKYYSVFELIALNKNITTIKAEILFRKTYGYKPLPNDVIKKRWHNEAVQIAKEGVEIDDKWNELYNKLKIINTDLVYECSVEVSECIEAVAAYKKGWSMPENGYREEDLPDFLR